MSQVVHLVSKADQVYSCPKTSYQLQNIKMKLFCLLISFFFVDVLADFETYLEYIFTTTEAMRLAYEKNDLTVGDRYGANALEHMIETMVDDVNNDIDYMDFCKINFLIAVPENTEIVDRIPQFPDYPTLEKASFFLHIMQEEIESILGYSVMGYNLVLTTPETIADQRREIVIPALRNIIKRRLLDEPVHDEEADDSILPNCRLLGLYLSTQFPESFTKELVIDSTGRNCIVTDESNAIRVYRKIDNAWSLTSLENINQSLQTLEEQLLLGVPPITPSSDESGSSTDEDSLHDRCTVS
ncbi:uncharacterized protein LOC126839125 isoform X2 [Adelges cooleyi]|uniref:uncharacterized protein LOC126839125 isoform X2 n=1 Tax=Adelges cooleyi TaxID=133065 RepID=UPI00217F29C8|nr:uncharacterized protein LOC126839125 isoform X2 [Adelges cooleyi]